MHTYNAQNGDTVLHLVAFSSAKDENTLKMVEFLLERNARVNVRNNVSKP
jgi:hypothetical protein